MAAPDLLQLVGKRVIVTGASSGMGGAAASTLDSFGAKVHSFDIKPAAVGTFHEVDLRDPSSIDRAVEAVGPVDVLLNCAGMPQTFPSLEVLLCNFAGLRHLSERVADTMAPGGAIASVSSVAGNGWPSLLPELTELVTTEDFDAAHEWFKAHPDLGDPYMYSKMAVNVYTLRRSVSLIKKGVRLNAIAPGMTDTPMVDQFAEVAGGRDPFEIVSGTFGRYATPQEQANMLILLCSAAASYVNGVILEVDGGFTASSITGQLFG